jgi:hypothetical protein
METIDDADSAACTAPCTLCGMMPASASRARSCRGGGGGRRGGRKRARDEADEDDGGEPATVETPVAGDGAGGEGEEAAVVPPAKRKKRDASGDEPDEPLAAELTDRQVMNRHVSMVGIAIGNKKVSDQWAKTIITQLNGLHGLSTAKRSTLLKLKCKGNKAIPSKLVDRLLHVFGPARPAKSKLSSKPTAAPTKSIAKPVAKPGAKPVAKPVAKPTTTAMRRIPRLP